MNADECSSLVPFPVPLTIPPAPPPSEMNGVSRAAADDGSAVTDDVIQVTSSVFIEPGGEGWRVVEA